MRTSSFVAALCTALLFAAPVAAQQPPLTIVNTGPTGSLDSLAQANEIRIVFSEPMVTLGRIPNPVTAPFVRITPAITGTFRWSGTTILIFTPDPKRPLPFATSYEVTVDTSTTAVSGRRLAKAETFRFTTPTVRLLQTNWYRRNGTADSPMVVLLRFNQPVRSQDVAAHLTASLERHDWNPPAFSPEEEVRLRAADASALDTFNRKVEATRQIAAGGPAINLRITTDWDQKQFPPSPDLVALETTTPVKPESWVRLNLDGTVPSPAGTATPRIAQNYTIEAEPAFFIRGFYCTQACDADRRNPIVMTTSVRATDFAAAIRATDISAGEQAVRKAPTTRARREYAPDADSYLTLEDAGFAAQPPDRRYAVSAAATLKADDGQTLGYPWIGIVENFHMRAFTSFGDGHGVWEKDGGRQLPFYARNLRDVRQWAAALTPSNLMPTLLELQNNNFSTTPSGEGTLRRLMVTPDRVQSHGLNLSGALRPGGTGLVWTAVREGELLPRTHRFVGDADPTTRASIIQVTNLGITVKDSPQNTLVFVTRLDTGAPVSGANVSIVRTDNSTFWRGTTGADGVAIAPSTPLRDPDNWYEFSFVVAAEKDGDIAYVGSNWNEGIMPWDFGTGVNLRERDPILRGSVFTDRGVYRLGEEVHFKAVLRHNTPTAGIRLLPEGTPVLISIRNAQDRLIDERVVKLTPWSSAEWTMKLPDEGALGNYSLRAILEADKPEPKTPETRERGVTPSPEDDQYVPQEKVVSGSFLVAAYRRPDFRVDVSLTSGNAIAGEALKGVVSARYLFGASMGARPVTWRYSKSPGSNAPAAITEKFGDDRWVFVGWADNNNRVESGDVGRAETTLTAAGDLPLSLETRRDAGIPYVYSLEGDVEDVSRQHIANRASLTVHPAPYYVGIRRPSYFLEQKTGLKTEVVAVGIDGQVATGVLVDVTLTQVQWTSVRRAEGNGFYTWDTERKDTEAGKWSVTTATDPVPLSISFKSGGYYILEARSRADSGRFSVTRTSFYVLGDGYTAWARFDHNRIDLVPERQTYRPGDTARIMIQSPWEQATALVTTEREGIRTHSQFALTSTQQSVSIPIAENDIPNVFVSVLLVKGRTNPAPAATAATSSNTDTSDPGKPSFRLGYVELKVEDRTRRLNVSVASDRQEYRPASKATLRLNVKDLNGGGAASEVTLWAVDSGVLSLTSYQPPDVAGSVYVRKSLQVFNEDNRQRIVSRRVLTPKGETDGGGGGEDGGVSTVRKDFRVLAFWLGSVTTGPDGQASVDVTLPESLTTYRIMAVAGDRDSRFGSGDTEVRTNKPVTITPAFPRFLSVGDSAHFGAVVGSQLPSDGTAVVSMRSLDPRVLELTGSAEQQVAVSRGGSLEVRFSGAAKAIGRARVQMSVRIGNETDAFEDVIPVEVLASPETVAAYGDTANATTAKETVTIPTGVVPGFGGLDVEVSSTAMVGLGEGARYLVEYPYGCAEQKASTSLALILAGDLGDAFSLPGMDPKSMRPVAQRTLKELEKFQCESGGFAYWPGACWTTSPYLTAYVLDVFKTATSLKYDVNADVRRRGYDYLEQEMSARPPEVNEAWWPSYTAWQAFAVKVLVEGGRNQDSNLTRLYGYRDRMPVFALAYLHDAMLAKGETSGDRVADLRRRMSNAIMPEGGSAHVEELADPYLLWFWNSNVRSTAIVLNSFVKADVPHVPMRQIVRWMMSVRKDGRWGNTQENAHAMAALVNYYRKYEPTVPNFRGVASLGTRELLREDFRGRSADASIASVPMPQVVAAGRGRTDVPLTFRREGTGTLFYSTRLRYAVDSLYQDGLDSGFNIERRYEPYVEDGSKPMAKSYAAGDLVRITLTFRLTKERRFVAVTDPLPAGFEPVEAWFATTARDLASQQDRQTNDGGNANNWQNMWRYSGFDHVERHDNRIQLFATRLAEGLHEFSYIARATTAGTFRTSPTRAEEMYEPEVFGRTATDIIEVKR